MQVSQSHYAEKQLADADHENNTKMVKLDFAKFENNTFPQYAFPGNTHQGLQTHDYLKFVVLLSNRIQVFYQSTRDPFFLSYGNFGSDNNKLKPKLSLIGILSVCRMSNKTYGNAQG